MKQLYTLKTTIVNPDYDKRFRYGQRSIPEFKAGKTFVVWKTDVSYLGSTIDMGGPSIDGKTAEEIIAHSEPVQPKTWHDVALVCGGYFSCADDTIDQLIKTGIVTPEQVVRALNTFLEQS